LYAKEFQGNRAVNFGLLGFVNDAHTAFAELFEDFVVGDYLTNHVLVMIPDELMPKVTNVPGESKRCREFGSVVKMTAYEWIQAPSCPAFQTGAMRLARQRGSVWQSKICSYGAEMSGA